MTIALLHRHAARRLQATLGARLCAAAVAVVAITSTLTFAAYGDADDASSEAPISAQVFTAATPTGHSDRSHSTHSASQFPAPNGEIHPLPEQF